MARLRGILEFLRGFIREWRQWARMGKELRLWQRMTPPANAFMRRPGIRQAIPRMPPGGAPAGRGFSTSCRHFRRNSVCGDSGLTFTGLPGFEEIGGVGVGGWERQKIIDKPVDRILRVPYFGRSRWAVNRPKIVSPLALRETKGGGNGFLSLFGIRLDFGWDVFLSGRILVGLEFGFGRRPCSSVGRARPW